MTEVGTLPTSGRRVVTGEPAGAEELLVLEGAGSAVETMLALARRLVTGAGDWLELPAVDLGAAALLVRRAWLGGTIRTEARCPAAGCGEQIDIAFGIDAYLDHHRPRRFRGVSEPEPGWFELGGTGVRFRVPTVGDLVAAPTPQAILERCVDPPSSPASVVRRIERPLAAVAPTLAGGLTGVCPLCGTTVELWFEPVTYVLAELRDAATGLFDQVHELALAYHWSEPAILGLDRRRRLGYVERVRGELVA
jgi:hypothetical protein